MGAEPTGKREEATRLIERVSGSAEIMAGRTLQTKTLASDSAEPLVAEAADATRPL